MIDKMRAPVLDPTDEGGADSSLIIATFTVATISGLSGSTLLGKAKKINK